MPEIPDVERELLDVFYGVRDDSVGGILAVARYVLSDPDRWRKLLGMPLLCASCGNTLKEPSWSKPYRVVCYRCGEKEVTHA